MELTDNIFKNIKVLAIKALKVTNFLRTWTRDSGRPIFIATSSRMKISGYFVLPKSPSRMSS